MAIYGDLSDDELRARLLQRGVSREMADAIVADRDSKEAVQRINEELGL